MIQSVPILMYHAVAERPPSTTRRLSVSPRALEEQLAYLVAHGFTGLTFAQLARAFRSGTELPERPVALTFDDGYADFVSDAWPILSRYGFSATVFVTTGWIADAGAHAAGRSPDRMMSWAQIRELAASNIEIGAHSHSHPELDQIDVAQMSHELMGSRELLENGIGRGVTTLAYPFGYASARVRAAARTAGFESAAAVRNMRATRSDDPFMLPRLTIRRATSMASFAAMVSGPGATILRWERLLTAGWAPLRAAKRSARRS
ncbi:polysaccharide deacetylase family protein [Mycolicibacterium sarraceniae]|uniref:NodB homology domain-containing protein n=1 Tax=Mycolicibacterium sarraceniae TaxID=1534348 RepID=A0A7I7SV06_9MYCO|nr:polysaccharide deacetylase family protein [Mycolicibacterium sarraceniae]BBY59666.1 hypothetical protein MSAR_28020 [Mycolicibacterium sarraceniae]